MIENGSRSEPGPDVERDTLPCRVLVTGRGGIFVESLPRVLSADARLRVGRTDLSGIEGAAVSSEADVVVVVVRGGDERARVAEAVRALRRGRPDARVVLLVPSAETIWPRFAAEVEAAGWVTWHTAPADVARAISQAKDDGAVSPGPGTRENRKHRSRPGALVSALTEREVEVLRLLAAGTRPGEIAASLGISPHTVRTHLQNIIGKVGARSRFEAVAVARREGLVE